MSEDAFTDDLAADLAESFDVDEATARDAAERAAEYREDNDESLTVETVVSRVAEAPYAKFRHRFNWALGDLSSTDEDRPDTTAYRFEGFGPISGERAAE